MNKQNVSLKLGLLSDSHKEVDYTRQVIHLLKELGAQYLIHAGDLCIEDNLAVLHESKLPYISVFGNNDSSLVKLSSEYNIKPEPYYFKIKDTTFKLMHLPYYMSADSDVVVYGHTHMFEQSFKAETLFINPGEVCARNKPKIETAMLEISDEQFIVQYHYKDLEKNIWEKKEFKYDR